MRIQYVSDLHIEYYDYIPNPLDFITPVSDILILAGDIGNLYKYNQLTDFLRDLCKYFKIVIYIAGNREYYRPRGYKFINIYELHKRLLNIQENIDNLYILDKSSIQIGDLCIVGATLWSDIRTDIPRFIVHIPDMSKELYMIKHRSDLRYIKKMIKYCGENNLKLLIVSHHSPTFQTLENKRLYDKYVSLYASNLDYLLENSIIYGWIFGHINLCVDKVLKNNIRLLSNQLGKPNKYCIGYDKEKIINVN